MEPNPSTSRPFKAFGSPRMKRKMIHFTENEKVMIINVFKYVKETWPADKYRSQQEMKDKTGDILGISKSAVYRILKEYVQTDTVKPAASPKKRASSTEKINRVPEKKNQRRGWVFVGPVKEEPVTNKTADVKEEPEWESESDESLQAGQEFTDDAEKECLHMDIEIKEEIEIGPEQLQPQDIHYSYNKDKLKKAESVIKQEPSPSPFEGC